LKFEKNLAMPRDGNEKKLNMPQKFEMKKLKIFIFEIWNEIFCLKFEKIGHITSRK
jgi:hypothetical protein